MTTTLAPRARIPNDLRAFRIRFGWSQEEAAKRVGVPRVWVSLWEAGRALPTWNELTVLAGVYGCSRSDLYPEPVMKLIAVLAPRRQDEVVDGAEKQEALMT